MNAVQLERLGRGYQSEEARMAQGSVSATLDKVEYYRFSSVVEADPLRRNLSDEKTSLTELVYSLKMYQAAIKRLSELGGDIGDLPKNLAEFILMKESEVLLDINRTEEKRPLLPEEERVKQACSRRIAVLDSMSSDLRYSKYILACIARGELT